MKIVVDLNRCQCYAQCAFLAPNVFEIHGDDRSLLIFGQIIEQVDLVHAI